MEMGEQYGLQDLRQLMATRTQFQAMPHVGEAFSGHRNLTSGQHYEMVMLGGGGEMLPPPQRVEFRSDSSSVSGFEEGGVCVVGDGGNGRWPRQETLTLLEVRSRLDSKFREANHKGPLWDEVSRIMAEEHGYQRSGKKCREKLENLYKYYKKTKEGKVGRQDGKHYRFFRQLEALYGENTNVNVENNPSLQITNPLNSKPNQEVLQSQKLCESLSFSNSSEFDTSSSEENNNGEDDLISICKKREGKSLKRGRKGWKSKIKEFIDGQMKKLIEVQEAWLEKMLKTLEHKEQERMSREEAWRKQESARFDREHEFWANERAWIEARDATLMAALQKISGRQLKVPSPDNLTDMEIHEDIENGNGNVNGNENEMLENMINRTWPESAISTLIKLRSGMESRFAECGPSKRALWEEISEKMGCLGYERSAKMCKEKWESINKYFLRERERNKKRKENSRTCPYFHHLDSPYSHGAICTHGNDDQVHETVGHGPHDGPSPSNSNMGVPGNDSCLRFLMDGGDSLWESYCAKINKGEEQ
ncbi:trihelix transcription factor PTL [Magnolia sinica]|uniref:trihelix transcription factor PTL n=1 Tax=Magnolia sinica TaxID=86752 RepID=UPI002657E879|nr:trihelix transcription factor PTL [Magnolia sinica]